MKLAKYKSKRNLKVSLEPKAKVKKGKGKKLVFVVQEHHARRLHYDLRLEAEGVLKSWAVPKGISMDPSVKRLAIQVEDHPYDYKDFEGVIPEGYGAGKVAIWDRGAYSVEGGEKALLQGIRKGVIRFCLEGKKLKGIFHMVRLKSKNQWLLMKKKETFTHTDKYYWPKEKITKGDLLAYYEKVAPYLLPHLKDRPVSFKRYPDGVEGDGFFQKNWTKVPKGIQTTLINKVRYLLIQDVESLLYAVNLGCIEIHPFLSRGKKPDYLVLDLDPKGAPFAHVVKIAQEIYKILQEMKIDCYCKTSGGSGLHIFVPLQAKYSYAKAKAFAKKVAEIAHERLPDITTLNRSLSKREGKVYIDFQQNHYGHTVVAPYSVRARDKALVSMPLKWREVKKGLRPENFTIQKVPDRLARNKDLFEEVLGKGAKIP